MPYRRPNIRFARMPWAKGMNAIVPLGSTNAWTCVLLSGLANILLLGCSRVVVHPIPERYPAEIAIQKVRELGDRNGDGKLDLKEAQTFPSLVATFKRIDSNGDRLISSEELQQRFAAYESMPQLIGTSVEVYFKGRRVAGATVTFTPEPFMGDDLQAYVGKTNTRGVVPGFERAEQPTGGLPLGFYSVRFESPSANLNVVRGCEIANDAGQVGIIVFVL